MRFVIAIVVGLAVGTAAFAQPGPADRLEVARAGAKPAQQGPAATFTGVVTVEGSFAGRGASRVSGATVAFEPGARSAWHTHPVGQTLIVTSGCGLAQSEGAPAETIQQGDVVWIPAGVRHWHGASPASAMSHVAVVESLNGAGVTWLEHVTDQQYRAAARVTTCLPAGA